MRKNLVDRLHERFASSSLKKIHTSEEVKKWESFLAQFPETNDCFELSYYKYLCRMYYFPLWKKILVNVLGFGAFFIELFYLAFSRKSLKKPIRELAVIERARDIPDFSDISPDRSIISSGMVKVIENHNEKFGFLCKEAKKYYWNNVRKHPFSFFYNYFVYMELVTHSSILLEHNPEVTVVYINERNVASPILTDFYNEQGRKLYSFMHGEYTLRLILGFMRFDRYYVWDDSYIGMFSKDLRCQIKEYVVYTPRKLQKKWNLDEYVPAYYCTYYFSGEDENTIRKIVSNLELLSVNGLKCKIRPHPRFKLHIELLKNLLINSDITLESVADVSLKESLGSTQYVIGLQSTVLSEAYIEGKEIVLDDVSNKEHFELLQLQKFNVFNKPHRLLSELIADLEI